MYEKTNEQMKKELDEYLKKVRKKKVTGCFANILFLIYMIVLWGIGIALFALATKVSWEIIKIVWSLW